MFFGKRGVPYLDGAVFPSDADVQQASAAHVGGDLVDIVNEMI